MPRYLVSEAYYAHLVPLSHLVCELRQAMVTSSEEILDHLEVYGPQEDQQLDSTTGQEEAILRRLKSVKIKLLWRYLTSPSPLLTDTCGGVIRREKHTPSVCAEKQLNRILEMWPSSPERCLEVGLGKEPRWVQWEWVYQCLDSHRNDA